MNDLNHANEFVRGSMLRFLCKVKDEEILTPLITSIKACLEHKHPYVRKNAALAVFHANKLFGDTLIPDAQELIRTFLLTETDVGARRNTFLILFNQNEEMAIDFLANNMDDVGKYGDMLSSNCPVIVVSKLLFLFEKLLNNIPHFDQLFFLS